MEFPAFSVLWRSASPFTLQIREVVEPKDPDTRKENKTKPVGQSEYRYMHKNEAMLAGSAKDELTKRFESFSFNIIDIVRTTSSSLRNHKYQCTKSTPE